MASLPTIEKITEIYLFGNSSVPNDLTDKTLIISDDLKIRPKEVDINEFMQGPGRFLLPHHFKFVHAFLNTKPMEISGFYTPTPEELQFIEMQRKLENLSPGIYSKQDIFTKLNLNTLDERSVVKTLGMYDDGRGDLLERAYVWNTSRFMIDDEAKFVVTESGERGVRDKIQAENLCKAYPDWL